MTRIQTPPIPRGSEKEQLAAVQRYLFTMSRQLEKALSNLDETNFAPDSTAHAVVGGGMSEETKAAVAQQAAALRSLIVKNADIVRAELDRITARLSSSYVAVSDYGSFTESISTAVEATARDITAVYDYYADIQAAVDKVDADFQRYTTDTGGYVRAGIVDWNGETPVFGVAVGQGISTTTVVVDGKEEQEIQPNTFLSVFTAQKLSFRQNDVEVAYLSNETLYITTANISRRIELADKWAIDARSGFAIKWVG